MDYNRLHLKPLTMKRLVLLLLLALLVFTERCGPHTKKKISKLEDEFIETIQKKNYLAKGSKKKPGIKYIKYMFKKIKNLVSKVSICNDHLFIISRRSQ